MTSLATEFDVIVVGSGAAGCAAALGAQALGASTVVLEKAETSGGTTGLSAGAYWIPNSSLMREHGYEDPRPAALEFMARMAQPALYDPTDAHLGLTNREYELLEAFYDHAADVVDLLSASDALHPTMWPTLGFSPDALTDPDYHAGVPENRAPFGHLLMPEAPPDFDFATQLPGSILAVELRAAAEKAGVIFLCGHRVVDVVRDDDAVVGVVVAHQSATSRLGARRGVVFATGGFAHHAGKAQSYLRGPIFGTGSAPASTGDFVDIAGGLGAALGNMTNAWWCQVVVDSVVENGGQADMSNLVFVPYGDSMLIVNSEGVRVGDEKAMYNERTQTHFVTDGLTWPNLVQVMIWDEAVATDPTPWPWRGGVPLPGFEPPWLMKADSLDGLAALVDERVKSLRGRRGISARVGREAKLAPEFAATLAATVERFNGFAAEGVDADFGRGEAPVAQAWAGPIRRGVNPTMYPLSPTGPYYAVLLGAGTLDTSGGPETDASGAVLRPDGSTIPGLFGAGNCTSAPTGQGYLGGGGTIGPALVFGWIAGQSAANRARAEGQ
jgi:succinate dehydrogenase/fumarate reductase flavoprotein subunit